MNRRRIGRARRFSVNRMADRIYALGKESGFFGRKDDLSWDELGQHIKTHRYGLETFIEEYENGYVLYHLGSRRIYAKEKGEEAFRAAQLLSQREMLLSGMKR